MARESLRIPNGSYEELRIIAEHFITGHYPDGTIPAAVEAILGCLLLSESPEPERTGKNIGRFHTNALIS